MSIDLLELVDLNRLPDAKGLLFSRPDEKLTFDIGWRIRFVGTPQQPDWGNLYFVRAGNCEKVFARTDCDSSDDKLSWNAYGRYQTAIELACYIIGKSFLTTLVVDDLRNRLEDPIQVIAAISMLIPGIVFEKTSEYADGTEYICTSMPQL